MCDGARARGRLALLKSGDGARANIRLGVGYVQAREQLKPIAEVTRLVRLLKLILSLPFN